MRRSRLTRRGVLGGGWLLGLLVAAATALPPLLYWRRSARLERGEPAEWVPLGPAPKLPEGVWLEVEFDVERRNRWRLERRSKRVYVRRRGREIRVLSPICPHADCLVKLQEQGFSCPCHRSSFDSEGRVLEGPAPRALDDLPWWVEEGTLLVGLGGKPDGAEGVVGGA